MTKKDIPPEDKELILMLNLLKTMMEGVMKTIAEAVAEVALVKTGQDGQNAKMETYYTKILAAINRLEAKIAAGGDAQPVFDALAPIKQSFADKSTELDVKIAEADTIGL